MERRPDRCTEQLELDFSVPPSPNTPREAVIDEHAVRWFAAVLGVELLPANLRTLCPVWINTGRTCRWDHSCRSHQLEVVDHAVQAMDESGHRCVVLAPYRFDADRARELSEWCSSRSLTWEVLPVTYWHPATVAVLIRAIAVAGHSWTHRPAWNAQRGGSTA